MYGADNTADPTASLETRVIARCPDCQTRYRIEVEKIGPNGSRIRCSQCGGVFRVEPEAAPGQATQTLLVAEPDADLAKRVAGYLRRWQIGTTVVHDGGQALLFLHREKPCAVIVGARLPGLRGAEFAEIVRRTAELAEVKLIRVVSDDEAADWHFEADHALGSADLPDGLAPILELGEFVGPAVLLVASSLASSVTDNIPLAAMLAKILGGLDLPADSPYWWAVIFGANLGGNITPIGSASTLVAVTIIHKHDLHLSFAGFVRAAVPFAAVQLALAVIYVLLAR